MESNQALTALEALSQESRLAIFRLLVTAGPAGMSAGRIAERMDLPAPTLSFHLAQLRHGGLIECRRDGRSLIYSANFEEMNGLVRFLTENCCGNGADCAPACSPASATPRKRKNHEAPARTHRRR